MDDRSLILQILSTLENAECNSISCAGGSGGHCDICSLQEEIQMYLDTEPEPDYDWDLELEAEFFDFDFDDEDIESAIEDKEILNALKG